jgi:hypothetical protein
MKVTIYFRTVGSIATYDFEMDEFRRMAVDYENYLKGGEPKDGVYTCRVIDESSTRSTRKKIVLQFDTVSAIG